MELETDKAVIEVPSSVSGVVREIRVKEGDKLRVGQVIFTVENGAGSKGNEKAAATAAPATAAVTVPTAPAKQAAVEPVQASTKPSEATSAAEFRLPELGENIHQGDLVRLMIAPGSKVAEGQPVMELETDKAVVEVPASVSGVVKEVLVKEGQKATVGQVIFTLQGGAAPTVEKKSAAPVEHVSGQQAARLSFQMAMRAEGKTEEQALPPDQPQATVPVFAMPAQLGKVAGTEHREPVAAAPHVCRLARELGLDIYNVTGTGPGGRVTEDDVKAYAKATLIAAQQAPQAARLAEPKLPTSPSGAKWSASPCAACAGERPNLREAWNTIPHVTQHDRADITELEQLRAKFAPRAEEAGGKMTMTAIALKVCASALKAFPQFNAPRHGERGDRVQALHPHWGCDGYRAGAAGARIRDVDKKNIIELAMELCDLRKRGTGSSRRRRWRAARLPSPIWAGWAARRSLPS